MISCISGVNLSKMFYYLKCIEIEIMTDKVIDTVTYYLQIAVIRQPFNSLLSCASIAIVVSSSPKVL